MIHYRMVRKDVEALRTASLANLPARSNMADDREHKRLRVSVPDATVQADAWDFLSPWLEQLHERLMVHPDGNLQVRHPDSRRFRRNQNQETEVTRPERFDTSHWRTREAVALLVLVYAVNNQFLEAKRRILMTQDDEFKRHPRVPQSVEIPVYLDVSSYGYKNTEFVVHMKELADLIEATKSYSTQQHGDAIGVKHCARTITFTPLNPSVLPELGGSVKPCAANFQFQFPKKNTHWLRRICAGQLAVVSLLYQSQDIGHAPQPDRVVTAQTQPALYPQVERREIDDSRPGVVPEADEPTPYIGLRTFWRGTRPEIASLSFMEVHYSGPDHGVALAQLLGDPTSRLARHLLELAITTADESDAVNGWTMRALWITPKDNTRLKTLELVALSRVLRPGRSRLRQFHGQVLPPVPLDLPSKLAFISATAIGDKSLPSVRCRLCCGLQPPASSTL
ncbi:hypothetical protein PHYSODRAFT_294768 [Phytophthora sojae]|uniref:Uncharacterized protein n=1 Tax=Phytophthora sojae (strain P6497) TaxID=1094619 RepID=G4YL12_PHYSP|nr:hypothetical protein PHYSODRAFT_294768 [Phytophthora sojae]EGZ29767.1 hypothetical protein PHYSODRAFT_294768 [Phytophthora sojae]|eukprot:XP_009517042.1 hypothetical protein PHYSODRAFT_294768 [Phytophthora sojae]